MSGFGHCMSCALLPDHLPKQYQLGQKQVLKAFLHWIQSLITGIFDEHNTNVQGDRQKIHQNKRAKIFGAHPSTC